MRRIPSYLVLLLLFACNETSQTKSESQEAENSIINNNKQIEKWYKDKKTDSLINYMADNVIQLPPNSSPLKGRDSVKKYWEQLFQFWNIKFSIRTQEVKVHGPNPQRHEGKLIVCFAEVVIVSLLLKEL